MATEQIKIPKEKKVVAICAGGVCRSPYIAEFKDIETQIQPYLEK